MRVLQVGFNRPVTFSNGRSGCTRIRRTSSSCCLSAGTVAVAGDGLSASFTPGTVLEAGTQYCFYVSGVVDLVGQALAQNSQTLGCFTTGASTQTTGPAVVAVSPPDGSSAVPVNAAVQVQVSEPVSTVSVGSRVRWW